MREKGRKKAIPEGKETSLMEVKELLVKGEGR